MPARSIPRGHDFDTAAAALDANHGAVVPAPAHLDDCGGEVRGMKRIVTIAVRSVGVDSAFSGCQDDDDRRTLKQGAQCSSERACFVRQWLRVVCEHHDHTHAADKTFGDLPGGWAKALVLGRRHLKHTVRLVSTDYVPWRSAIAEPHAQVVHGRRAHHLAW